MFGSSEVRCATVADKCITAAASGPGARSGAGLGGSGRYGAHGNVHGLWRQLRKRMKIKGLVFSPRFHHERHGSA